jgi:hypothetical protein
VSSTKLRLLLDESVTDPLARRILRISPSAVYVRDSAAMKGKEDEKIAEYANKDGRIIVAIDSDYKELYVREGVIKMTAGRSDEDCLFAIFRAFWQSGHRRKSRKRRAYLTNDGFRITNGETLTHAWHPKPCPHHGGS